MKRHAARVGMKKGTGFTQSNPCSRARDVALFRGHSGPICTIEVMLHSPRVIAVASIVFHPSAPDDAPAGQPGQPGPDSLGVAPIAVGAAGTPAYGVPRRRSPPKSCDSDAPGRGPGRSGSEARDRPDPDRVTRMTRTCPVVARTGPGRSPRAGPPGPVDSDDSESAGEAPNKEITFYTKTCLTNRPSIRDTPTPSMRRRDLGVPVRPGGQGHAERRQGSAPSRRRAQARVGRWRSDAAPGPALDLQKVA